MKRSLKNKKILITCGPTLVPVDPVRVLSNRSTGTLGQMIAEDCAKAGAVVTLLEGPVTQRPLSRSVEVLKFVFFDEFAALIRKELKKKYDACIHAAAVSDYKMKRPCRTKLSSRLKALKLDLVPTQKIITQIKRWNPKLFLVGFKLEPNITRASAKKKSQSLFENGKCDLIVANSTQGHQYSGYILDKLNNFLIHKTSRRQLSKTLVNILKEAL